MKSTFVLACVAIVAAGKAFKLLLLFFPRLEMSVTALGGAGRKYVTGDGWKIKWLFLF